MNKKISIITISYNSISTIEKTIKSVLSQSHRPLEYVFVDGGSTDGTVELIKKYETILVDNGIEVNFKSEKDNGISDAFNKGIERATGDIIGIINSDDQLEKESLKIIASEFDEDTDVVCGDCLWIDKENNLKYIRKSEFKLDQLKYRMVLMHPTCFVKKEAYNKFGLFDTSLKYAMDRDLLARFYKNGAKFKYTPKVISIMYAGGVSDVDIKKVFDEGAIVSIRNGVPKWKVQLRKNLRLKRHEMIVLLKKIKLFRFIK